MLSDLSKVIPLAMTGVGTLVPCQFTPAPPLSRFDPSSSGPDSSGRHSSRRQLTHQLPHQVADGISSLKPVCPISGWACNIQEVGGGRKMHMVPELKTFINPEAVTSFERTSS